MQNQTLYVGIDLGDEYSYISCYDEKLAEPVSIRDGLEETDIRIPSVLLTVSGGQQWLVGKEAMKEAEEEQLPLLKNLIKKMEQEKSIQYLDKVWDLTMVLSKLFRKFLWLVQNKYPDKSIGMVTVSIGDWNQKAREMINEALLFIGLKPNQIQIISHKHSAMYYALSQKKELWQTDVGVFDFNSKGLFFHQLCVNKRTSPITVGIENQNFSDELSISKMYQIQDKERLEYIFDNIAKKALHKKVISTIYITGDGFEGDWADKVLKGLCVGRRVFAGQNLYAAGACYGSLEACGIGKLSEYLYLSEEMVLVNISVKIYQNTEIIKYPLCKAGFMWYDVEAKLEVVPDDETELEVEIYNVIEQKPEIHFIHIDSIMSRPPKATILELSLRFLNSTVCVFRIKDKGFGDFYPSTNRIWEKEIHL